MGKGTMKSLEWKHAALTFLARYARVTPDFTCQEAFAWAYGQGLPVADSPKMLGPVFKLALIDTNMVRVIGVKSSPDPVAKGRKVTWYQSMVNVHFDGGDPVRMQLAALVKDFKLRKIDATTLAQKAFELGVNYV